MINNSLLIALAIALCSIIWVELVRDYYHYLAHIWTPLSRLHSWHHRVFKPDLSVNSVEIYRQAHWYNDVPESLVMLLFSIGFALLFISQGWISPNYQWLAWLGSLYTLSFTGSAIARGLGVPYADEITDATHRQGDFTTIPAHWFVNRSYHWRHHFDDQNAYFCGTFTIVDRIMGTALSLKGKKIAVTGANGTLGQALIKQLYLKGAKVTALTSQNQELFINVKNEQIPIKTFSWQVGEESNLTNIFEKIDILILNHGINVYGEKTAEAIEKSYEINAFSGWRMMELFLKTVKNNQDKATKEIWVNTSEAEVNPAFSPLYEISKRTMGDLVTLKRVNSPIIIRKLILGPFKSKLNPMGVMSGDWVAKQIVNLVIRDFRDIIVTINPFTYLIFPFKEWLMLSYCKVLTK
ncbi:MAG: bifunctional sterol desaturase/short chain dehydrogenase [Cyanobacteria bacterium]|nr:bifunctional sterol desaturase/short chain dehydrogenase [Cyanobacteria bacterium CG_2015-16_32_12]NCO77764.1 bifunctional sterol desaturase/short chain dehydrogenase [Cyanobacteria bacterium CG_2015-22_32_23]NCQ03416.1 bifunctional sterol desaturase/short chain dehydrogenase [Cyanobacteria bacterium CG_2015-09_32_10]NCQ41716.1 bifunctional sterol desaturase/short chain dehydrogenase [Cyanobacteria bacterium CG_2015-04_32_10]NCS83387.1 bifunctional sterol desaturase/short chain dehydrogenase